MRSIKHWNFKYIKNRINLLLFEKFNPLAPWLTEDSIKFLEAFLLKSDIGFEWGSGRSTIWFAGRTKHIVSIEYNKLWYERVNKLINEGRLKNINYNLLPLENNKENRYSTIINNYDDNYFDYILIDGKERDKCANFAINKIKKGGILILDNAERYLPNNFDVPASIGNNFKTGLWREFYSKIINKRKYWTTNGIFTTLIVFM